MDEITMERLVIEKKEIIIYELMDQYGQEILQLSYSYVKNRELAEDLTQDIFVKCYQSLHTYKGKSKIRTWLWRIAINHCKDYLKSWYKNHVFLSSDEYIYSGESGHSTEQAVIRQDEEERLAHSVMRLPIKYREVIYLHYFEEMPIREMAQVLSINNNTVKTRLRRAKALLKDSWEGYSEWKNG